MSTTSPAGIIAAHTTLPVLAAIVVGLRLYVRSKSKGILKTDDLLQLFSLAVFIGMAVVAIYGVKKHAFGYPSGIYPLAEPPPGLFLAEKLWFIYQIMQIAALASIKITALLFYRRIFVVSTSNWVLNTVIWVLIVTIIVWGLCFIGYYVGICGSHVSAAWDGVIPFATFCFKSEPYEEAYAASDFILDTFILIVPQPSIWSLHMKLERKIAVSCVFLLALIGYAASIARLAINVEISTKTVAEINTGPDVQSDDTQAVWFAALETGFALIAVNLPAIWPLFTNVSIQSLVNSVRSALSLNSLRGSQTTISRPRNYNELDGQNSTHDNVELVPGNTQAGITTTTEGGWQNTGKEGFHNDDLESGIRVQKSIQVSDQAK